MTYDGFRNRFGNRDTFRVLLSCLDVEGQLSGRHPVNQALYLWGKTMLPNYILSNLGDRMEMAHSVEGRLPFLDHPLVEEAARIPHVAACDALDIGRALHISAGHERFTSRV